MKNKFLYNMLLIIIILSLSFPKVALSSELKNIKAISYILMDKDSGRILAQRKAQDPMAMASTTKIMTAIIALENGTLSDTVTVSKNATLAPPVKMYLKEGEEISLENLLYATMLQSSNDAAVAIAEHISGNVDLFCEKMTEKAKEIGCKDTKFCTPNGLDKGDHHSTAEDMAKIACYALNNKEFVRIINTKNISFKTNKNNYDIINKDRFLSEYQGAEGIKTGFTGKAGHCFVGAVKRDDMELISVVLASGWGSNGRNQKWVDTKNLMNYGYENYKYYDILDDNSFVYEMAVTHSRKDKINLVTKGELKLPLKVEEKNAIKFDYNYPMVMDAPITSGQEVGEVTIMISENEKYQIPIIAESSAERHDFKTSIKKIIKDWLNLGLTCILE